MLKREATPSSEHLLALESWRRLGRLLSRLDDEPGGLPGQLDKPRVRAEVERRLEACMSTDQEAFPEHAEPERLAASG